MSYIVQEIIAHDCTHDRSIETKHYLQDRPRHQRVKIDGRPTIFVSSLFVIEITFIVKY
jgi:hypothetical protein